jgi:serine phosphatase RsbU (regulator of sigma subunit)
MSLETMLVENLATLNRIAETLNRGVDVRDVLNTALAQLIELMGLESGWIFVRDPAAQDRWWGSGYVLAAHHNLPPALDLDLAGTWEGGCDCQGLCNRGMLTEAYNEVRCSRLANAMGDRRGLTVHASTPLRAGDEILGILNVAGPDWASFSPQALALLTNVGSQMGVALERARLFDMLREQRIREQATLLDRSNQLLARRGMDDLMAFLVEETKRLLRADACALLLPGDGPGLLAFRASSGWHRDPVAEGRTVPIDEHNGTGQVMLSQQPLLVEDVEAHDPAPWLPDWLGDEGFRGHAVVPLVAEGRSIGVLVLDTRQPRAPNEEDVRLLRLIANQAAIALENARLYQEEIQRRQFEHELALGRQVQLSLLPKSCPVVPGWECAAVYEPARIVAGDFYDFIELPGEPGRLGVVIADVVGKGVAAALYMALSRTMVRTAALSGRRPAQALTRANKLIRKDSRSDQFVTVLYAVLDPQSGKLVYSNAGHNRPLWLRAATGEVHELAARGIVLGIFEEVELEEQEIDVAPGDLLLFYTDGVTEATNAEGQLFGEDRLRAVIVDQAASTAEQVLQAVMGAVEAFVGDTPQSDDVTLFVLKRWALEP